MSGYVRAAVHICVQSATHRALLQLVKVRFQNVELDPVVVTFESHSSNEQDDQHDVREDCSEVNDLKYVHRMKLHDPHQHVDDSPFQTI